jgi:RNA 3'-terminal phosphate cyclase (ATP)
MFEKRLSPIFGDTKAPEIDVTFEDSHHEKRYYLLFVATTSTGLKLGRDWLYDGGVRLGNAGRIVPNMVKRVSDELITEIEHGGCVDEWMRDQLVVFQTLARGRSHVYGGSREGKRVEPSLHAQTAMWVAERIVGVGFDHEGGCMGIGFCPGEGNRSTKEEGLTEEVGKLRVSE